MRITLIILALVGLIGCQTPAPRELSNAEITPLATSINIGSFPVSRATMNYQFRSLFREGNKTGSINSTSKTQLNVTHQDQQTIIDETFISIDVGGYGFHPKLYAEAEQSFAKMIGVKIITRFSQNTSQPNIEIVGGELDAEFTESIGNWGQSQRMALQTGKTLRQGQELFTVEASEFFGGNSTGADMIGQITARVIGQALYDDRPVIVAKLAGLIGDGSVEVPFDGLIYIDIITGIPSYTRGAVAFTEPDGNEFEMSVTSHLNFSQVGQILKKDTEKASKLEQPSTDPLAPGTNLAGIRMFCFVGESGRRFSVYVENSNSEDRTCSATCSYNDNGQDGVLTCSGTIAAQSTRAVFCTKYSRSSKFISTGNKTMACE